MTTTSNRGLLTADELPTHVPAVAVDGCGELWALRSEGYWQYVDENTGGHPHGRDWCYPGDLVERFGVIRVVELGGVQ